MKYIFLGLILASSSPSFADFVYMKEDQHSKTIQLKNEVGTSTVSDSETSLWALYPDISPDGNEFLYVEGSDQSHLHLVYKNKDVVKKFFLPNSGMLLHPKFSKNGKMVFYSAPGDNGKNNIFSFNLKELMEKQGKDLQEYSLEGARNLTPTEEAYFPRPSSDGNFFVYQRNFNGKKEVVLQDLIEGTKVVIAEGMSPALSFDETLIAFTTKRDGNWNIYAYDRTKNETTQMTYDEADEMAPTFMPDNTLAFASSKSGNFQLYKLKNNKWISLTAKEEADLYAPQFSGEKSYLQKERAPYLGNPRSSFGTVSHNGKIYMAGGHQGAEHTYPPESFSDSFIAYDVAKNQWTELAPRPMKAHGYQIAAKGNYIYAFGGFAYDANNKPKWKSVKNIDRYNITTNTWEAIGELYSPRSSNIAVTINDKVYLAAGWDSTPKFDNDYDGTFLDTVEIFDLNTEKVSLASYKLPSPKRRALTGIEYNGKFVLIGGIGEGASHFDLLNKVTAVDPITGKSTEMKPLPFATFAPAAEILNDELMVFGGMFKTGPESYEYVSHIYSMNLQKGDWRHTGRFLQETKGFSQVFKVQEEVLGVLGGHRYFEGKDSPVLTFETIEKK